MKTLSREQALHCANIFNDYFGQFDRIDQYMRDQKMAQIETLPTSLPGMGFDSDMFDDFTMSPQVMDLQVVELDNHTCRRNQCFQTRTNLNGPTLSYPTSQLARAMVSLQCRTFLQGRSARGTRVALCT